MQTNTMDTQTSHTNDTHKRHTYKRETHTSNTHTRMRDTQGTQHTHPVNHVEEAVSEFVRRDFVRLFLVVPFVAGLHRHHLVRSVRLLEHEA